MSLSINSSHLGIQFKIPLLVCNPPRTQSSLLHIRSLSSLQITFPSCFFHRKLFLCLLAFEQSSNQSPSWQLSIYYHFSVAYPPNIVPHKRLPMIIIGDVLENSCVKLFICHLYLAVEKIHIGKKKSTVPFSFFFFLRHVKM